MMKASLVFALFLVGAVAEEEQPLDVGGPAEVDDSEAVPGAFIEASAQQGVGVSAGVGSSEQAYWLPPASGGMVGGPPQGGPGGGGGGPGGAPMMQATPSSPYTSAYSVQPQAFYNLLESYEHEGQRLLAPPAGPHQFYYIHNAHPDQYAASMQNEMRFKRRQSAYHRNKAGYTVIHDESRSAYKMKRSGKHHHHLAKHAKPAAETAEVRFKAEASLENVPKHKHSSLSHKLKKAAEKLHHKHKHNKHKNH